MSLYRTFFVSGESMGVLTAAEWRIADAIASIGHTNPFLPERLELEKRALGKAFVPTQRVVQFRPDRNLPDLFPNIAPIRVVSERLLTKVRSKWQEGRGLSKREWEIYESLAYYQLYSRYMGTIHEMPVGGFHVRQKADVISQFDAFTKDYDLLLGPFQHSDMHSIDCSTLFAGLFQIERAFYHIFRHIVGTSSVAAQLRASIWNSIFSHDMRRYMKVLYQQMRDITTLITGPSGTGKELVAQAIAYSSYVAFDPKKKTFEDDYSQGFLGINLSAIPTSLLESELFGHAKGAFTDARNERQGFLDPSVCPASASLFLDEIGELPSNLQVKLLRVLQTRKFQRIGESKTRNFLGRVIAATNRNIAIEVERGSFREDFYYRICSDRIQTPSLAQQLSEASADLELFVRFIAQSLLPNLMSESERLVEQTLGWIQATLGGNYEWPGNFRELEQCVRSIMIRGNYLPLAASKTQTNITELDSFLNSIRDSKLDRDSLVRSYVSFVYSKTQNFREAGRILGVDWRTVKELIDLVQVAHFNASNDTISRSCD
jgi:DNA-binding NtrC family response regulator